MYSILYLPDALYVKDSFSSRKISTCSTLTEVESDISEILNIVKFNPCAAHLRRYHFEIVEV